MSAAATTATGSGAPERAESPFARDLPDLVFVAVLGLLGIVGFRTVYGGWSWLVAGGAGLAAGIALGIVGRQRRFDPLLIAFATVAVYFVLSGVAISEDSLAGVAPTPASVRNAATGAVRSWAELITTVPPVGRLGTLGVVPMICGLVGGVLATSAALRTKGIARPLIPLVAVLVVAILFGTSEPASLILQGAAFGAVAIGWVSYRRRGTRASAAATVGRGRVIGGVLMATLAAVTATKLGDHLPGADANERFVLRERSDPPFDPKQQPSPLAAFAQYKSDDAEAGGWRDRTMFRVEGLPKDVPIRLAVMDTYDGVVWKVAGDADGSASSSGVFERVGASVPTDAGADVPKPTETARVQITIDSYNDIWVPDIGSVTGIQFGGPRAKQLAEALRFNRTTNVGAVPLRLAKGDRIIVDAAWAATPEQGQDPHPYAGAAAGAGVTGPSDRVAEKLVELAERIDASGPRASATPPDENAPTTTAAPGAATPPGFSSVLRVAEEFVIAPSYGYSDGRADAGEQRSVSGHSYRRLTGFADDVLRTGVTYGNGEHYASALALISRELRMPSRVVMGFCFAGGCEDGEVTGNDVSAWVEVNVDGVGWVPLNATPDPNKDNVVAVKPKPKPKPKNASQPPPPPVTVPPPEDIITDNVSPKKNKRDSDPLLSGAQLAWIVGIGMPLLLIGGFVWSVLHLKKRRRHRRESGDEMDQIIGGWRELDDRALDLGRPLPSRSTRREIATYLGSDAARHSARVADAAIWGPTLPTATELDDYWTSIDEACDAMAADERGIRRLRADLNPASLVRSSSRRIRLGDPGGRRSDDGVGARSDRSSDAPVGADA